MALTSAAVLGIGIGPAEGQVRNFTNYTSREGLPQAQVLALHQDHRSFLWFGTYGGLTRFDGHEFRTFTRREGLSANAVRAIAEDALGRLIVGTVGGGACRRTTDGFRCLSRSDGLPNDNVSALLPEPGGGFWVATEGGLARVGDDLRVIRTYGPDDGLPGRMVTELVRDGDGQVWAATDRGLARFDGDGFVGHPTPELARVPINALAALPDGLLIATADRLFVDRGAALEPVPVRQGLRIVDAVRDGSGRLWIATNGGVLEGTGHGAPLLTRDHGLLNDAVNRVIVDREGNLWFGTESGLSKLTPGPFSQFTELNGLPHPFVRALAADRLGRLWVGTRDGVALREHYQFRPLPLPGVPDRRVYALASLPDGGMLVGTRRGLVHYDGGVRRVYQSADGLPSAAVLSLLPDGDRGVWVGTAAGVAYWTAGRLQPAASHVGGEVFVVSLARDDLDRLWIGRRAGGVVVLDRDGHAVLGAAEGLSNQTIWTLANDGAGNMWVGTNGDGAFRVERNGEIRRFTVDTGLTNDIVWQIRPDRDGSVWLFTSKGLNRYVDGRFEHYGPDKGLFEPEGSASAVWQDADGDLWFGTGHGLIRYQAALDVPHTLPPPVYVESAAIGSDPLAGSAPQVPAGAGLRIRYTSPSFRDSANVSFRYRLGRDDEWSPLTTDRSVTFARLEPGRYDFEVEAFTSDGGTSSSSARYAFTVLPAYWQTTWFRALAIVVVLGLTAAVPWLRGRHLRREHRRLEGLVAEKTRELAERNRQLEAEVAERIAARASEQRLETQLRHAQKMEAVGQLAGGIAHDFNNLLTAIVCHAEFAKEGVPAESPASKDLAELRRAAEQASNLVSQLLTFSRQQLVKRQVLDLNVVTAESARMLTRVLGSDVALRLEVAPAAAWVLADQGQLDQILLNLAVNARDAMPTGGRLTLSVARADVDGRTEGGPPAGTYVVLEVADSGHGIDPSIRDRLFDPFFTTKGVGKGTGLGLATVYGIVNQNGWHISVDSEPGRGARFRIHLPLGNAPADAAEQAASSTAGDRPGADRVVLVAEDQESVRKLICQTLARKGYQVLAAPDGMAAVELSGEYTGHIDLLLSDMIMPGLNGRQAAERITVQRPGIRVLFMSGHADGVLGRNGLIEDEHTQLIRKPFTPSDLAARVEQVLNATETAGGRATHPA